MRALLVVTRVRGSLCPVPPPDPSTSLPSHLVTERVDQRVHSPPTPGAHPGVFLCTLPDSRGDHVVPPYQPVLSWWPGPWTATGSGSGSHLRR